MLPSPDGAVPSDLSIAIHLEPGGVRLALAGELDLRTAGRLAECLDDLVRASTLGDGTLVHLDLTDLAFLDVSGLTALVRARATVAACGGRTVVGADAFTRQVVDAAGLGELLVPAPPGSPAPHGALRPTT